MHSNLVFSLTVLCSALTIVMGASGASFTTNTFSREMILERRVKFNTDKDLAAKYTAALGTLKSNCPFELKDAKIELVGAAGRYMKPTSGSWPVLGENPLLTHSSCTDPKNINEVVFKYAIEGYYCGTISIRTALDADTGIFKWQNAEYQHPSSYHGKNVPMPINFDESVMKLSSGEAYNEAKTTLKEMAGGFKKMDMVMMNWLDVEVLLFAWNDEGPVPVYRFMQPKNDPQATVYVNAKDGRVVSRKSDDQNMSRR